MKKARKNSKPPAPAVDDFQESPDEHDDDTLMLEFDNEVIVQKYTQWASSDDVVFIPSPRSVPRAKPGLYEICHSQNMGIYFELMDLADEEIIKFPDSNSDRVIKEIETFWEKESLYRKYGLAYKRGILLYGPPGSGKTCTIKLLVKDVVQKRGGIVVKFTEPGLFSAGMRILRSIQKDTPIIVLMEDLDAILEMFNESDVINILDGVTKVSKIVFLATTNYPEKLGERILNRPSRFDKRIKIGMPNAPAREMYLRHISRGVKLNFKKWVKDTEGLSVAHIKELFTSVNIIGSEYEDALATLHAMSAQITSANDGGKLGL